MCLSCNVLVRQGLFFENINVVSHLIWNVRRNI